VAEKKISRKELLKEPDEFLSTSARVLQFFRENPKIIYTGAALFIGIIVASLAIYGYMENRRQASHLDFKAAYAKYAQAVASPEPVSKETWQEVFNAFEEVAQSYGSMPAGEKALLYSGHALYQMGDYEGALKRYDKMKSTSLVEKGLGELAMYHKAMTLIAMKKYEPAVMILDEFSKNTDSPYRREAYAAIARIYESMGKNKEATQTYKQYLKMFPKAPDAPLVKARIARLSSEG
jgi:predicted negative regulator of RcsB-dependent stress response